MIVVVAVSQGRKRCRSFGREGGNGDGGCCGGGRRRRRARRIS